MVIFVETCLLSFIPPFCSSFLSQPEAWQGFGALRYASPKLLADHEAPVLSFGTVISMDGLCIRPICCYSTWSLASCLRHEHLIYLPLGVRSFLQALCHWAQRNWYVCPHHCMLHDSIQQDVEKDVGYTLVALQHSDNHRPYDDCDQIISAAVRQDVHCLRQADKSLQDDKESCVVGKRASQGVVAVSKYD